MMMHCTLGVNAFEDTRQATLLGPFSFLPLEELLSGLVPCPPPVYRLMLVRFRMI